jgi:hypothetical protein
LLLVVGLPLGLAELHQEIAFAFSGHGSTEREVATGAIRAALKSGKRGFAGRRPFDETDPLVQIGGAILGCKD